MRTLLRKHHNLIVGILFFAAGTILSLHLSAEEDRRQIKEIDFQRKWKTEERQWFDSNMVQSARKDSLLKLIIKRIPSHG